MKVQKQIYLSYVRQLYLICVNKQVIKYRNLISWMSQCIRFITFFLKLKHNSITELYYLFLNYPLWLFQLKRNLKTRYYQIYRYHKCFVRNIWLPLKGHNILIGKKKICEKPFHRSQLQQILWFNKREINHDHV